jgi:hypothetical protein
MSGRRWILAAASVMAGCTAKLPHPAYVAQPTTALAEVDLAPPPARVELIPDRPAGDAAKGAVWIDGEWSWRGRKWSWKSGRWVVPPMGAAYSPWTSVRGTKGEFFYAPGTWRDGKGVTVTEPPALAVAAGAAAGSVDPDVDLDKPGGAPR